MMCALTLWWRVQYCGCNGRVDRSCHAVQGGVIIHRPALQKDVFVHARRTFHTENELN